MYLNNPLVSKRSKTPAGVIAIQVFLFLLSLLAAFGFSVSFIIDEEYFPTGSLTKKLVVTYLICAVIGLPAFFGFLRSCFSTRNLPEVLIYGSEDFRSVYVYSKGEYLEIPVENLVGSDDRLPAKEYHYFCGKTHSIADSLREAGGRFTLRYRDGLIVRRITLPVDNVRAAEDSVFSLKELSGSVNCRDGILSPVAQLIPVWWPAHFLITLIVFLGCAGILAMLISFEIDDIDWNGYLNVKKIIIMSVCFLCGGGFPLFLYLIRFKKHRHSPTDLVLTDAAKSFVYLYKNGNYIKLPVGNITGVTSKNFKVAVYNSYWNGFKKIGYYTSSTISDGSLKISYNDANGFSHTVKYYVTGCTNAETKVRELM